MYYSFYQRANNLLGFIIFSIAATVYCLTVEPSASFWDCPEFITSAYKLEVGHPPGAPFFMLTANFFTQLSGHPEQAAKMVNYMSALMSGATILFLFWTITHLTRRLLWPNFPQEQITRSKLILILGCGTVGALAYTFSDTFWFSAVEGEVYASSSLFTALVFWLILKWEDVADAPHSDRWLILIAYLTGLSIGVHLLNLLCLPAIVLVYYYRKRPNANAKGSLLALVGSFILVCAVLYILIPGVVKVGGWFELFFVNTAGLSFNSGTIIYLFFLAAVLIWGVYESYSEHSPQRIKLSFLTTSALLGVPYYILLLFVLWFYLPVLSKYRPSARAFNTTLLCLMMIVVGYSSYALIMVRSTANPPMDQNSPEDILTIGSYLNREQYGTRPLLYGQAYSSERTLTEKDGYCTYVPIEGEPTYQRKDKETPNEKDSYIVNGHSMDWKYAQNMLFPRMYSPDHANYGPDKVNIYKQWVDIKGYDVLYNRCGESVTINMPTQWENIQFFLSYQLNYMYWRYFLWNFVGRQNDIQGQGEIEHGNWITGIHFIDKWLIGDPDLMPKELKENKGHNVFYGLPLLLGIIGLLWQVKRNRQGVQGFWVVFFLFFMTGIAIIIYLNQTPLQVRERDYAYAGSFYAFSIWIGMGVAGVYHAVKKLKINQTIMSSAIVLLCLCIPIQMASQTWDDHDRSGRFACRDIGRNYLTSAQKTNHPIIFNNGDNDTFPLWYAQEVEGIRTDIRTCNFSYLNMDWYIDQMKRPAYDSPALPITWKRSEYQNGTNDVIAIRPEMKQQINAYYQADPERAYKDFGKNPYELSNILHHWMRNPNEKMRVIPTDSIVIKLDKKAVLESGISLPDSLHGQIPEYMHINLQGCRYLTKSEIMLLELIAQCNWIRPIYIAKTVGSENYRFLKDHLRQEGMLNRITPFNTTVLNGKMDSEKTYESLMNHSQWGGIENPNVYMDETCLGIYSGIRATFTDLAAQLIREGKNKKALQVLSHCLRVIPEQSLPFDNRNNATTLAECYYELGQYKQADKIITALADKSIEYLTWYSSMRPKQKQAARSEYTLHLYLLNKEIEILSKFQSKLIDSYTKQFKRFYEEIRYE